MSWSIDGKDLSNLAWNVKSRSAGWAVPGRSGDNIRVPGRHGSFWVPNKTYDEGHLTLSMWAVGCNEDGTLPNSVNGQRKVRENLDRLTSMFSTNRRLLTLRQTTEGSGGSMINEIVNPIFTTTSNTGVDLAIDGLKDGSLSNSKPVEVSRDVFTNPYLKGKTVIDGAEDGNPPIINPPPTGGGFDPNPTPPSQGMEAKTEDIYPDPSLRLHTTDTPSRVFASYYYPINQNNSFFNAFFTPINGFSWTTAAGALGNINQAKAITFSSRATIGELARQLSSDSKMNKASLFMRLQLGPAAKVSSISLKVIPYVSDDGTTWRAGTSKLFTITNSETWVTMSAGDLPNFTANSQCWVKYTFELPNASSWDAGSCFKISKTAIQDAPKAGNPWIGSEDPTHMIVGGQVDEVTYHGTSGKSLSTFQKSSVPEWVAQHTVSKATTAPYAFAWAYLGSTTREPRLCFSVLGGTKTTFRRALPKPTIATSNVRIWGKCSTSVGSSTLRLMKSNGTGYDMVATVSCSGPTFSSTAFQLVQGASYILELDTPSSGDGLNPSIIFTELHVSNGSVSTIIQEGQSSSNNTGSGTNAGYTGEIYDSTIIGKSYGVPRLTVGRPREGTAVEGSVQGTAWASQPGGAYSIGGSLVTESMPMTNNSLDLQDVTVRTYMSVVVPPHLGKVGAMPTSANVVLTVTLYKETGGVSRTVDFTLTGVNKDKKNFYNTIAVTPTETAISAEYKYSTTAYPMTEILIERLQFILNKPAEVLYFTGSEMNAAAGWPGTPAWAKNAFFSESYMTSTLPSTWTFEGFKGFDSDGAASFTGTKIRIEADLEPGKTYFGMRRGPFVANQTISVQPQGASSATSLGTTTSATDFAQGFAVVPSGGATYVDFIVSGSGATKTAREAFAITRNHPVYPVPSTTWAGFSPRSQTTLNLPNHPSSQVPPIKVTRKLSGITELTTGDVEGWSGDVIGGGFIGVPSVGQDNYMYSNEIQVNGGYVSVGARIQPTADTPNRLTIEIQGATVNEYSVNTWTTLSSQTITTTAYQTKKLQDVPVGNKTYIRVSLKASNSDSGLNRTGVLAIMDGVSLTRSSAPLGSAFPGYFTGIRGVDGTTSYRGDIRQCKVEVVEAVDMESMAYGNIAEFNVSLVVPGSFWEDVYDTTTTISNSGTSGTFSVADFGGATAPMMDLIMEVQAVTGSLTDFTLTDKGSGSRFRYKGPAQSRVSVNNALFAVTDSRGNSLIRYVVETGSSSLTPLTPYWRGETESLSSHLDGTPVMVWSSNVPIKITITGRRKYLIG